MSNEDQAPTRADVDRLMKRCQIGVGGRGALDDAHDIMAGCYGTLGALMLEIERHMEQLDAAVAAERERCACVADSWATAETATTCANVAAAIRGA